jgi:copper chaperone CopZ
VAVRIYLLTVSGMTSDVCAQEIAEHLLATDGVEHVEVDPRAQTARVEHDDNICTPSDLLSAVRRAGCQVNGFEMLPE